MSFFEKFIFSTFCKRTKKEYEELIKFKNDIDDIKNKEILGLLNVKNEISKKDKELKMLESSILNCESNIDSLEKEIFKLKKELDMLNELDFFADFGLYEPKFPFANSSELKERLDANIQKQKLMVKDKTAMICTTEWTVGDSKKAGKQLINNVIKLGLKTFNADCDLYISKCKYNNFDKMKERIKKSFEKINELNKINLTYITREYLNLKLQELEISYEYEQKKQKEKEELKELKLKEKEEALLRKEIEQKTAIINKDLTHYNNALLILKEKLEATSSQEEKVELENQISEIENNITTLKNEVEELDYRLANIGAGYVYIISNVGSFGKDVFKIGVTRRLDPTERIDELSSASVPFKFEINALIFDHNAYALEKYLHDKFDKYRINLANSRKEFFNLTLDMIEKELKNYGGLTFEFNKSFESEEYFETLKIREKMQK